MSSLFTLYGVNGKNLSKTLWPANPHSAHAILGNMIVIHVIFALASIIVSALSLAKISRSLLKSGYVLTTATAITGIGLLFQGASVEHVCVTGVVYTLLASGIIFLTKRRLVSRFEQ